MTASTIIALATARGKSAIAIIRMSGPATRFVVETISGALPQPRRAALRAIGADAQGRAIDNGLVIWFEAPQSYTGEDCAELHVHGGTAVISGLITLLLSFPDVRLAEAGEFTKRAVLNNKLDLASAEAVSDLIEAETELQRRQAFNQLDGALTRACKAWQSQLVGALAHIESALDFSDEADIPTGLSERAGNAVKAVISEVEHALAQANYGERVREGFRVAILGAPNAGKSTLLNQLCKRDIAIVTAIPGTTRDALEVACDIDGLPIVFVDTAGFRDSSDPIEKIGIQRSRMHAKEADLILWLVEPGSSNEIEEKLATDESKAIIVGTKSDLGLIENCKIDVHISVHADHGLDILREVISGKLSHQSPGNILINRQRHRTALEGTREALLRALQVTHIEELFAEDIRLAIRSIGRVVGMVDLDRVLDRVFSEFCIGK